MYWILLGLGAGVVAPQVVLGVLSAVTPTSMTFWRRDLTTSIVSIRADSILYEVGDYFTIAGKFRTLRARIPHARGEVEIPLFPLYTRKVFPRSLPREDLEQMVERLDGMRPVGEGAES